MGNWQSVKNMNSAQQPIATDGTTASRTTPIADFPVAAHTEYILRLADSLLVMGHRMSEWTGRAPVLEEEMALANIGLDLLGSARTLLAHAGALEGRGRDEDALAFRREATGYRNYLLAEQPNGDFAMTMARQVLWSAFAEPLWAGLKGSRDELLAGVAAKAEKEAVYHLRHTSEWVIRLGDGTDESHARMQRAIDGLWTFTDELFEMDAIDDASLVAGVGIDHRALRAAWDRTIGDVLDEATLKRPVAGWMQGGGRRGQHTEALSHMLAVMQSLHRAHPGAIW
jgi:ring-1,2-phenylacetyl-CoA epoxidase subunit PaaC